MATRRSTDVVTECWRQRLGHIGILPEVLLYRILEFAEPPPVNRRATSWASMREEDSKEEDEGVDSVWVEEVAREIVSQPKRVREAAPFVSGHGQFLEKTVFSSPTPSSTRISIESFVCGALLVTSSMTMEMGGGGSSSKSEEANPTHHSTLLSTSPTSVCDILGLWGVHHPSTHLNRTRAESAPSEVYLGELSALNLEPRYY